MPPIFVPKVPTCVKKTTLESGFREKHVSEFRFHKRRQEKDENVPKSTRRCISDSRDTNIDLDCSVSLQTVLYTLWFWFVFNPRNSSSVKLTSEACLSRKKTDPGVVFPRQFEFGTFGTNIGSKWIYGICSAQLQISSNVCTFLTSSRP